MNTIHGSGLRLSSKRVPGGFTLVEMLVVITIISLLASLLVPALSSTRESGRRAQCMNNLHQFGVGLTAQAERNGGKLCSGAFNWVLDGSVTDIGWVADLVNQGTPVGKMLCPSNPYQVAETYNDLLQLDPSKFDTCVDPEARKGSASTVLPDGTSFGNPCRAIIGTPGQYPAGDYKRQTLVEQQIYEKFYNTNYTASWFLVRSAVALNDQGQMYNRYTTSGCLGLQQLNCSMGPLTTTQLDSQRTSSSFVPMLACGGPSTKTLPMQIGIAQPGDLLVATMTAGPVRTDTLQAPDNSTLSASNYLTLWNQTLQDYRNFGPVHRGACNILFADSSVRTYFDTNGDHYLNNGFDPNRFSPTVQNGGFTSASAKELPPNECFSGYSLRDSTTTMPGVVVPSGI